MKLLIVVALALASVALAQLPYPPTRTVDASETYFGVNYKDPYRWLENLKDPEVRPGSSRRRRSPTACSPRSRRATRWPRSGWSSTGFSPPSTPPSCPRTAGSSTRRPWAARTWGSCTSVTGGRRREAAVRSGDVQAAGGQGRRRDDHPGRRGLPPTAVRGLGFSAAGAEYSELRILDVAKRELLPESCIPRTARSAGPWTRKSFFYDMGKVHDIKSLDIELNRKTKDAQARHAGGRRRRFLLQRSQSRPRDHAQGVPTAFIDESYPEYVIGQVGTVQNEMRLFYAPVLQMKAGKLKWSVLCQAHGQPGPRPRVRRDQVYAVTHAGAPRYKLVRTSVTHPDWQKAETVLPEAQGLHPVHRQVAGTSCSSSTPTASPAASSSTTSRRKGLELKLPASGTVDITVRTSGATAASSSPPHGSQPPTLWDFDGDKDTFAKSIFNTP